MADISLRDVKAGVQIWKLSDEGVFFAEAQLAALFLAALQVRKREGKLRGISEEEEISRDGTTAQRGSCCDFER